MSEHSIYTTGGTVQAGSGIYLPRQADEDLLALCQQGALSYVLTPRQMGKSSLMINTANRLREEGRHCAIVDLQALGTDCTTAEEWYLGFLVVIEPYLELETNVVQWWQQHTHLGFTQRMTLFFEQVLLVEVLEQVIIFVDEIDSTLSLDFTDDFFAVIRYLFLARAEQEALHRLSFVLIGVATPGDLIRDPQRTPFNVGQRVDLTDFTWSEALPLAAGLGLSGVQAEGVMKEVLDWTGGHPYLTQRLCGALVEAGDLSVEQVVRKTFFGQMSEKDSNLQLVRDMLTKKSPDPEAVLRVYRQMRLGEDVLDEEQSLVKSHLKLSGIVRREDKNLVVRNRIYAEVFDSKWIQQHLPENFWKRYGPVLKWLIPLLAISFLVAVGMTALYRDAQEQRRIAEESTKEAKKQKMIADGKAIEAQEQTKIANENAKNAKVSLQKEKEAKQQTEIALENAQAERQRAEEQTQIAKTEKNRAEQQTKVAQLAKRESDRQQQIAIKNEQEATKQTQLAQKNFTEADRQQQIAISNEQEAKKQTQLAQDNAKATEQQRQIAISNEQEAKKQTQLAQKNFTEADRQRQIAISNEQEAKKQTQLAQDNAKATERQRQIAIKNERTAQKNATEAKKQRDIANTEKLSSQALSLRNILPQVSLLLSGESSGRMLFSKTEVLAPLQSLLHDISGVPLSKHNKSLSTVAFIPNNGNLLVTGSQDGTVRLWDKLKPDQAPITLQSQVGEIKSIAVSPDGKWLAVAGTKGTTAQLWNIESSNNPKLFPLQGHTEIVNALSFSPDSTWLATGSDDKTVRLWNMKTTTPGNQSVLLPGHSNKVTQVIFSSYGHWLATGESKSSYLWDMKNISSSSSPTILKTSSHSTEDDIRGLVFSPDEKYLAAAVGYSVQAWDLTAKNLPNTAATIMGDSTQWINSIAFSPNNRHLATGGINSEVKLWDMQSLNPTLPKPSNCQTDPDDNIQGVDHHFTVCRVILRGHQGSVGAVTFGGSDGKWLASASTDGTARLWDTTDLVVPPIILRGHEGQINALAFDSSGQLLATAGEDTQARLWKIPNFLNEPITYQADARAAVAISSEWIATADTKNTIRLWSRTDPNRPPILLTKHSGNINDLAFTRNGRWLASASDDGTALLWRMSDKDPDKNSVTLKGHNSSVSKLAISSDDSLLATGSWDTKIRLWELNASDPSATSRILDGNRSAIRSLAFSQHGKYLVSGSGDSQHSANDVFALIWDLSNPSAQPTQLTGHTDIIAGVDISPDNRWVATAAWDGSARIWDLKNSQSAHKVIKFDPVNRVIHVKFSADGKWLAAGSWNFQVQLQDMTKLNQEPFKLVGHKGRVFGVQFSPDSQWLATAAEDNTIRLWNPSEPQAAPVILQGHNSAVGPLAFSADGHWLLSGSTDARLWRVNGEDLSAVACRTAGRNLTPEEWQRYLPGKPYHQTCPLLPIPDGVKTSTPSLSLKLGN
jgi:WD40 repeat protein